ncbi:MAG: hypothetical protein WD851_02315 [Pirellulales bacterium]
MLTIYRLLAILLAFTICNPTIAQEPEAPAEANAAEEELPPQEVKVAEGRLILQVPGDWKQVKPRSRLVEVEFAIPEADKDVGEGRMTIMASGGTVEDNVARWIGQFRTADGQAIEDAEPEELEAGGLKITTLDLAGTYRDMSRGPFGPATELPDHRMLGAIVPTDGAGNYYVKLYGPTATIEKAAEKFTEMVKGIVWK